MERLHDMKITDSYLSIDGKKKYIKMDIHSVKDAIFYECLHKPNAKFIRKSCILKMYASLFPELTENNNPMCENYIEFLISLYSGSCKVISHLEYTTDKIYDFNFKSYDDMKESIDGWLDTIEKEIPHNVVIKGIPMLKMFYGLEDNREMDALSIGYKYDLSGQRAIQIINKTERVIRTWIARQEKLKYINKEVEDA